MLGFFYIGVIIVIEALPLCALDFSRWCTKMICYIWSLFYRNNTIKGIEKQKGQLNKFIKCN